MSIKISITSVQPIAGEQTLVIRWSNAKQSTVDLSQYIRSFPVLEPLADPVVFGQVQVGEWGFDVTWGDDLELAATTLHRLALEQAGEVMPTPDFKQWMARNRLSLTTAATELGFTRRTITAYSSGAALIPKHVALACRGWEYEHQASQKKRSIKRG